MNSTSLKSTKIRVATLLTAVVAAAVFTGSAAAWTSAPGSYYKGALSCDPNYYGTAWGVIYPGVMFETAPSVKAADTTPGIDHQRIWLHIVDHIWVIAGGFQPNSNQPDLWLYADATDQGYTNQWRVPQSGALANGPMDGVANVIASTAIIPGDYDHTYWNELWYPNSSGAYTGVSAGFYPAQGNRTQTAAYEMYMVPTC